MALALAFTFVFIGAADAEAYQKYSNAPASHDGFGCGSCHKSDNDGNTSDDKYNDNQNFDATDTNSTCAPCHSDAGSMEPAESYNNSYDHTGKTTADCVDCHNNPTGKDQMIAGVHAVDEQEDKSADGLQTYLECGECHEGAPTADFPDAPVANDATLTVNEDTVDNAGTVTATDADAGDTLTFTVTTQPEHGAVVMAADGKYTYTPAANYFGTDSFVFTVTDAAGATDTGTVSITVTDVAEPDGTMTWIGDLVIVEGENGLEAFDSSTGTYPEGYFDIQTGRAAEILADFTIPTKAEAEAGNYPAEVLNMTAYMTHATNSVKILSNGTEVTLGQDFVIFMPYTADGPNGVNPVWSGGAIFVQKVENGVPTGDIYEVDESSYAPVSGGYEFTIPCTIDGVAGVATFTKTSGVEEITDATFTQNQTPEVPVDSDGDGIVDEEDDFPNDPTNGFTELKPSTPADGSGDGTEDETNDNNPETGGTAGLMLSAG